MTDSENEVRKFEAQDRFEAVRGKADIKWRTDDLMVLLRSDERGCLMGRARPGTPHDPGAI